MPNNFEKKALLVKSLRGIICSTFNNNNNNQDSSLADYDIYKKIRIMNESLFLPVRPIHLSQAYIDWSIALELQKNDTAHEMVYDKIFNYQDMKMFINNGNNNALPWNQKETQNPFLWRNHQDNVNGSGLQRTTSRFLFNDNNKHSMYVSTPYKGPPKMHDIVQALRVHIDVEYMKKVPGLTNPLSKLTSFGSENVLNGDGKISLLASLVNAFTCSTSNNNGSAPEIGNEPLECSPISVVNIENDTITPRTFQCKKGICHLRMVVNKKDDNYLPFNNEMYFPRFTLDDNATDPQLHGLCFFVVFDAIEKVYKVVTFKYTENLATHFVTDNNAFALVYIGLDVTDQSFQIKHLESAIRAHAKIMRDNREIKRRSLIEYKAFEKLVHPKLFKNYYCLVKGDNLLRGVYDIVQKAFTTNSKDKIDNLIDIARFFLLHESQLQKNDRTLSKASVYDNYYFDKFSYDWIRIHNQIVELILADQDSEHQIKGVTLKPCSEIKIIVSKKAQEAFQSQKNKQAQNGPLQAEGFFEQGIWHELYAKLWKVVYDHCPNEPTSCAKKDFKNLYDALCVNYHPMKQRDKKIKTFQIGCPQNEYNMEMDTLNIVIPINKYVQELHKVIVFGIERQTYRNKEQVYGVNIGSGHGDRNCAHIDLIADMTNPRHFDHLPSGSFEVLDSEHIPLRIFWCNPFFQVAGRLLQMDGLLIITMDILLSYVQQLIPDDRHAFFKAPAENGFSYVTGDEFRNVTYEITRLRNSGMPWQGICFRKTSNRIDTPVDNQISNHQWTFPSINVLVAKSTTFF